MDFNVLPKNLQEFQQNIQKIISSNSLKDLIKRIRQCKTLAEERTLIQKESFEIRNGFKQEKDRYLNVEKLLYIHMLGYGSHFGQIECLKLAASPKFTDKRLAYLGTMLLLDENQETLTLLTNCLKNDMESSNIYIVGLALCVLGSIASAAMARDLTMEVERLLKSPTSYIRKKAALTAIRIVRKNPDLKENFLHAIEMLNEKNHGVLLAVTTLLYELCLDDEEITETVRQKTPIIVNLLKGLASGGASPEHDVSGICDPFLQVKLLKLLRLLGTNSKQISDQMNDVLTLVCTATESSKNVGNSVLYEAVLTILNIESDSSQRVLAINLLGKFLTTSDNNVKYVALITLTKAAQQDIGDSNALQRHRSTILDCLKDPDVTIRKRALELAFHLLNSGNIRILTRELLSYLEMCADEEKAAVSNKIVDYAGRFRPNVRWELDTLLKVLKVAGRSCDQSIVNEFAKSVTTSGDMTGYVVMRCFALLKDENCHKEEKLVLACLWCVGEYGDVLVGGPAIDFDKENEDDEIKVPTEFEIFETICKLMDGPFSSYEIVSYGLSCLVKLTTRLTNSQLINNISSKIAAYKIKFDVDIQKRACEYTAITSLDRSTASSLLERIPKLESAIKESVKKGTGYKEPPPEKKSKRQVSKVDNDVVDLLGGLNLGGSTTPSPVQSTQAAAADLLGDLFGTNATSTNSATKATPPVSTNPMDDLLGLGSTAAPTTFPPQELYANNGLAIFLATKKESGTVTLIKATFTATQQLTDLSLQIAVPKTLKLAMQAASSSSIAPGQQVTQLMKIDNPTKIPMKIRARVTYNMNGQTVAETVEFDKFDSRLWL